MRIHLVTLWSVTLLFLILFFLFIPASEDIEFISIERSRSEQPLRVLFVGDMMLGRRVEELMQQEGSDYLFQNIQPLIRDADFVVSNLEGPLPEEHVAIPYSSMRFSFATTTAPLLHDEGIHLVSLANNHTFDFGNDAYLHTRMLLTRAGVSHVGHPYSDEDHAKFETIIRGMKVCFAAFNATRPSFDVTVASRTVKGCSAESEQTFVLIHWGEEYVHMSNKHQEKIAHELIAAGADAIIGHHSHVVQTIEVYEAKPIFYSLGNFIFDQYFSRATQEGLAVVATFTDKKWVYELTPLVSIQSQSSIADPSRRAVIFQTIVEVSASSLESEIKSGFLKLEAQP